jgi:hypothetical protein
LESITQKREDYLFLKLFGKAETEQYKNILHKSNEELSKFKNSKMLLDLIDMDFSVVTTQKIIVFAMILFDVLKLNQKKQIAVLVKENCYDKTVKKYANLRTYGLQVFHTEDEAITWLKKSIEEPLEEIVIN